MNIVYEVIDTVTGIAYIGSKKNWKPSYKTSCKVVKHLYDTRPDTLYFNIVSKHGTYREAYDAETFLLKAVDARNNEWFYNGHNNDMDTMRRAGKGKSVLKGDDRTDAQKEGSRKQAKTMGKYKNNRTEDQLLADKSRSEKVRGQNHPMWGRKHSPDIIKKMGDRRKGVTAWNKGIKVPQQSGGNHWTKKPGADLSHFKTAGDNFVPRYGKDNPTNNPKYLRTCEHCGRTMNKSHITRFHGDKCKAKGGVS